MGNVSALGFRLSIVIHTVWAGYASQKSSGRRTCCNLRTQYAPVTFHFASEAIWKSKLAFEAEGSETCRKVVPALRPATGPELHQLVSIETLRLRIPIIPTESLACMGPVSYRMVVCVNDSRPLDRHLLDRCNGCIRINSCSICRFFIRIRPAWRLRADVVEY